VGAFAEPFFGRLVGPKGPGAALVAEVAFDPNRTLLGFVLQAQLKTAHAAALHFDLGVVDEVF